MTKIVLAKTQLDAGWHTISNGGPAADFRTLTLSVLFTLDVALRCAFVPKRDFRRPYREMPLQPPTGAWADCPPLGRRRPKPTRKQPTGPKYGAKKYRPCVVAMCLPIRRVVVEIQRYRILFGERSSTLLGAEYACGLFRHQLWPSALRCAFGSPFSESSSRCRSAGRSLLSSWPLPPLWIRSLRVLSR